MLSCGCAHVASTKMTFLRLTDSSSDQLTLKIARHLDTIVHGPDIEEDQLLTLEISDYDLNQKLLIPSESVNPQFFVNRFGPSSYGESFVGYIILHKVSDATVEAKLHLTVTARTASGNYVQTAKFRGKYVFVIDMMDSSTYDSK